METWEWGQLLEVKEDLAEQKLANMYLLFSVTYLGLYYNDIFKYSLNKSEEFDVLGRIMYK